MQSSKGLLGCESFASFQLAKKMPYGNMSSNYKYTSNTIRSNVVFIASGDRDVQH